MRSSGWVVFASLMVVSCFAQQPGTVETQSVYAGSRHSEFGPPPGSPSTRSGNAIGSIGQGIGYNRAGGLGYGAGHARRGLVSPIYVVPLYGGYGYGYATDSVDAPASEPSPAQAPPTVIINQTFVLDHANTPVHEAPDTLEGGSWQAPGPRVETSPSIVKVSPSSDQSPLYLIAFRDHSVVPAVAYWTEGNVFKYLNLDHGLNQVALDLVDIDMSRILNQQRKVEFRLPAQ